MIIKRSITILVGIVNAVIINDNIALYGSRMNCTGFN